MGDLSWSRSSRSAVQQMSTTVTTLLPLFFLVVDSHDMLTATTCCLALASECLVWTVENTKEFNYSYVSLAAGRTSLKVFIEFSGHSASENPS